MNGHFKPPPAAFIIPFSGRKKSGKSVFQSLPDAFSAPDEFSAAD